jgi:hypothetical protein
MIKFKFGNFSFEVDWYTILILALGVSVVLTSLSQN